jgi:hypothetical protein
MPPIMNVFIVPWKVPRYLTMRKRVETCRLRDGRAGHAVGDIFFSPAVIVPSPRSAVITALTPFFEPAEKAVQFSAQNALVGRRKKDPSYQNHAFAPYTMAKTDE